MRVGKVEKLQSIEVKMNKVEKKIVVGYNRQQNDERNNRRSDASAASI